jgi:hypothetical protein
MHGLKLNLPISLTSKIGRVASLLRDEEAIAGLRKACEPVLRKLR